MTIPPVQEKSQHEQFDVISKCSATVKSTEKKSIVILNQKCIGSEFVHPDVSKNNWQLQMTEGVHMSKISTLLCTQEKLANFTLLMVNNIENINQEKMHQVYHQGKSSDMSTS